MNHARAYARSLTPTEPPGAFRAKAEGGASEVFALAAPPREVGFNGGPV